MGLDQFTYTQLEQYFKGKFIGYDYRELRNAILTLQEIFGRDMDALRKFLSSADVSINNTEQLAKAAERFAEEANSKSDLVQTQLDQVVGETVDGPALEQMKVGGDGTVYPSPDARVRAEHEQVTSELSDPYFYEEITTSKHFDELSSTTYYLTRVPHIDSKGDPILLKKQFQNDAMNSGTGETVRSFVNRTGATLATNGSIWDTSTNKIKGVQIKDGVVLQDVDGGISYTLGVKADNTLVAYAPSVTAEEIIADGCLNTFTAFFPMIVDGQAVGSDVWGDIENPTTANPRQVIAQFPNKDILFLTCEGRQDGNVGMTYTDCIRILEEIGVTFAYCLDGGGSAQTVLRNILINTPIDGGFKVERAVSDFIYFEKPTLKSKELTRIDVGEIAKKTHDNAVDISKKADKSGGTFTGRVTLEENTYLNGHSYYDNDKSIYGKKSDGTLSRMMGIQYDDRFRLGNTGIPLSLYSSIKPTMVIGNTSNGIATIPSGDILQVATMANGWTSDTSRIVKFGKLFDLLLIIQGYAKVGDSGVTGDSSYIFMLPEEYRPATTKVKRVATLSATETDNRVVIYPDGRVTCSHAFSTVNSGTGIALDMVVPLT